MCMEVIGIHWAAIPSDLEPGEDLEDVLDVRGSTAIGIQVIDAQGDRCAEVISEPAH